MCEKPECKMLETVQNGRKRNGKRNETEGQKHRKIKGFWANIPNIPEIPKKNTYPLKLFVRCPFAKNGCRGVCFCFRNAEFWNAGGKKPCGVRKNGIPETFRKEKTGMKTGMQEKKYEKSTCGCEQMP